MADTIKICLIRVTNPVDAQWYPSIGFGYLKAYTESIFPDKVKFCVAKNMQEVFGFAPHILGVSCFSQDFDEAVKVCKEARDAFVPFILMGGFHITAFPETLPETVDAGILGEGEITFSKVISCLFDKGRIEKKDLARIEGIIFRNEDGSIKTTPARPVLKDLDMLPLPDRKFGLSEGQKPYLFTSRGCPYRCSFCTSSKYWPGVRYHSAKRVVAEIEDIRTEFPGIELISFWDDLTIANHKRFKEIVEIVDSRGINKKINFSSQVRSNLVNQELCNLLLRANVRSVGFGAESGSDEILKKLKDKSCSIAQNQRSLDLFKDYGINCGCSFVLGHYDETEEDVIKTYNFILDNYESGKLSGHETTILTPMPGTKIWDWASANGYITSKCFRWGMLRYLAVYSNNLEGINEWIKLREENSSIYLNEKNIPIDHLYQIIKHYEDKISRRDFSRGGLPKRKTIKNDMDFTGERFAPEIAGQIAYEHLHRYAFACNYVSGVTVLDLSCGEGYGSNLLAKKAKKVIGVDISKETIKHATKQYANQHNLKFLSGSCVNIPCKSGFFDIVVSFETIEHINEHEKMLDEIKRVLKQDGILIISSPNKKTYTDDTGLKNEYHVKELYYHEFMKLLRLRFKQINMMGQRLTFSSYIWPLEIGTCNIEFIHYSGDALKLDSSITAPYEALYFNAICTNSSNSRYKTRQFSLFTKRNDSLNTLVGELEKRNQQLAELDSQLGERDRHIGNLEAAIREREVTLNNIYNSHGWKLLTKYYSLRNKIFPANTKRSLFARIIFNSILKPKEIFRNINISNLKKFIYYLKVVETEVLEEKIVRKISGLPVIDESHQIKVEFDENITTERIESLTFPCHLQPLVSIIIPIWNKWQYTYHCLDSLLKHTDGVPYEVIIVDDASDDETSQMLEKINNIKVIRNKSNLGFVEACNIGAKAAEGKYVLFLNNDTQATNGWLKAMIDLAENDDRVGAVGAKLIFPDGKLQEAGGIVWNDPVNLACNYGKYDDPNKWEYNYVKEVDYCSAACLLIKKNLFESIGLFGRKFIPGYCEDADLAFSIRELGYKVMYQPKAEVIHFEGISAGTDLSQGMKQFQVINQEKFYKKWKSVLEDEHFANGQNVFLACDRSKNKKVILYIDHRVPTYDKDAGSFITYEYLKVFLEMGFKIIFWPDNLNKMEPYTSELQQMGLPVVYGLINFNKFIKIYGKHINVVYLSRPSISIKYIDQIRKHTKAKINYMAIDLHFLREKRRAEIDNDSKLLAESEEWKKKELYVMSRSDTTLFFSHAEQEVIHKEYPNINVDILPWIQPLNVASKRFEEKEDIIFIGGFAHPPNEDAVLWFADEIFPLVKKEIPEVRLIVLGSNPTERVLKLKSDDIVVTGYISDISSYFQNARVFVAPLRYGAGFKGKIVQAMSYGLPPVTTTIGSEGINLNDGKNALIADVPQEFARKIVKLYKNENLWTTLSINSLKHVQENYSKEVAKHWLKKNFNELLQQD